MCSIENIGLLSRTAKFKAVELYIIASYVVESENVSTIRSFQIYQKVRFIFLNLLT